MFISKETLKTSKTLFESKLSFDELSKKMNLLTSVFLAKKPTKLNINV